MFLILDLTDGRRLVFVPLEKESKKESESFTRNILCFSFFVFKKCFLIHSISVFFHKESEEEIRRELHCDIRIGEQIVDGVSSYCTHLESS